jgi:uncharacterized membrane protein
LILRKLRIWFFAGLVVLLPVWLTIFTVVWLFQNVDQAVIRPINDYLGISLPGLGVLIALVLTTIAGWLTTHLVGRQVIQWGESVMHRLPVVRSLYPAVKQVTEAVFERKDQAFTKVVLVEYPRRGIFSIGFVAGELAMTNLTRVWIPPGPSPTAGPVLLIPADQLITLPMSVEDGFRFIVSAGVLIPSESEVAAIADGAAELQQRGPGT